MKRALAKWIAKVVSFLDSIAKVVAGIAAIGVMLSLIPSVSAFLEAQWAARFQLNGYVYYEVTKSGGRTAAGNLALLRSGSRDFRSVRVGDKLFTQELKNFRDKPTVKDSVKLFVLPQGKCLIVLSKERSDNDLGGWLRAAPWSCAVVLGDG